MPLVKVAHRDSINFDSNILTSIKNVELAILTKILRLALPNTACWIISFFAFFQFFLNILAELTMFGDREFYKVSSA